MSNEKSNYLIFHNREGARGGNTVILKRNIVLDFTSSIPIELKLNVGYSRTHRDDNYNKDVGFQMALGRLSSLAFKLESVSSQWEFSEEGEALEFKLARYEILLSNRLISIVISVHESESSRIKSAKVESIPCI